MLGGNALQLNLPLSLFCLFFNASLLLRHDSLEFGCFSLSLLLCIAFTSLVLGAAPAFGCPGFGPILLILLSLQFRLALGPLFSLLFGPYNSLLARLVLSLALAFFCLFSCLFAN